MENATVIKVNFCTIFDYALHNGKYVGTRDENLNCTERERERELTSITYVNFVS